MSWSFSNGSMQSKMPDGCLRTVCYQMRNMLSGMYVEV